jgi:hypothetical protein
MMWLWTILEIIIIVSIFAYAINYLNHKLQYEAFEDVTANVNAKEPAVLAYPPNGPSPVDLYNKQPYHLLSDVMQPPRMKESISCVNSRSCYATDFQRMIEKTGTFRQLTNNYKRGFPDSCTGWQQELALNFYKADTVPIPVDNTGGSVSEA